MTLTVSTWRGRGRVISVKDDTDLFDAYQGRHGYSGSCPCGGGFRERTERYGEDADGNRGVIMNYVECEECGEPPQEEIDLLPKNWGEK